MRERPHLCERAGSERGEGEATAGSNLFLNAVLQPCEAESWLFLWLMLAKEIVRVLINLNSYFVATELGYLFRSIWGVTEVPGGGVFFSVGFFCLSSTELLVCAAILF